MKYSLIALSALAIMAAPALAQTKTKTVTKTVTETQDPVTVTETETDTTTKNKTKTKTKTVTKTKTKTVGGDTETVTETETEYQTQTVTSCGNNKTTTTTKTTSTTGKSNGTTTTTKTTTTSASSTSTLKPYPATGGASVSGNPYAGMPRYVNIFYNAEVQASIAQSSDSTYKAAAAKVAGYPSYVWLDTMSTIPGIADHLAAADAQSGGKDIVVEFVIYDLPGRDCHAFASNGEIKAGDITTYKSQYIDPIVAAFSKKKSNIRLVLLIEPDSLPNIATNIGQMQCTSQSSTDYNDGIAYAIAKLSAIPNTYLYLDAAHGGWLGWPDNQTKMVPVFQKVLQDAQKINSSAKIRGFASNTANYSAWDGKGACPAKDKCPLNQGMYDWNPCIDEKSFIAAMNTKFQSANLPTRWIHDTSRNGQVGIRQDWGSWCNIKGAGIGARPSSEPADGVDAFVWAKPPGESDGVSGPAGTPRLDNYCDPTTSYGQDSMDGAPQAGKWFEAQFEMLIKNAVPSI